MVNSVFYDRSDMAQLESDLAAEIRTNCCSSSCYCAHCVTVADLRGALKFQKAGKSTGHCQLNT